METLKGAVIGRKFLSPDGKYTVLELETGASDGTVIIRGDMGNIGIGSNLVVKGSWIQDKKYGRQFQVEQFKEAPPNTLDGLEKYLANGPISGIGSAYARKIVDFFKENTINIIENEPNRLLQIKGIGAKKLSDIMSSWQENKEMKDVIMFTNLFNIPLKLGKKIYERYGNEAVEEINKNPYQLIDDIHGVGFVKADTIARKIGIGKETLERCCAGLVHVLKEEISTGHCFTFYDDLIDKSIELLDVDETLILDAIDTLLDDKEIIEDECCEDTVYYKSSVYCSEFGIAERLFEISNASGKQYSLDIDAFISDFQKKHKIRYDRYQARAIKKAIQSKIMILTGLPGTGKTSALKCIAAYFEQAGSQILLAAPTGRASKRLSEATGMKAKTIHLLLEAMGTRQFKKNENDKLSGDLLIIDETSMVDCFLMYNLLKALPDNIRLLLVGDEHQLPSIGPGNVLKDLTDSGMIPHAHLTVIHRQEQESQIITNAHLINEGKMPDLSNPFDGDFYFAKGDDTENMADIIIELCAKRLPGYRNIKLSDIQVLTPQKKTAVGKDNLNMLLQSALNKNLLRIKHGEGAFILGDKVIQTVNDYDKKVFNGDIGFINDISLDADTITVNFDGSFVTYERSDFNEIELAYAITVHKSQGSEYPVVVLPMTRSHHISLQRNLLYTAVTRGKQLVIIVGERQAVRRAVKNDSTAKRNTLLADRIFESFENNVADNTH